jgi:hypothetical protein
MARAIARGEIEDGASSTTLAAGGSDFATG